MISHFKSHDHDPRLYPRCTKYFRSYHNHSPCNIKYNSDRSILEKPFHLHSLPFDLLLLIRFLAYLNTTNQNNTYNPWYSWTGSNNCYFAQYCGLIPFEFFNLKFPWFSNPYTLFLLWKCVDMYMLFLFCEPMCIHCLDKVNLCIQLKLT